MLAQDETVDCATSSYLDDIFVNEDVVSVQCVVFSFCGKLIGHLPVCGWLRVATAFMKRKANSSTSTWDEEIYDKSLRAMMEDTVRRVKQNDPAKGRWDVVGEEATLWVDASSLALGIVIEVDGHVVEDASWQLRSEDSSSHINMAELDAVIKGGKRGARVEFEDTARAN